MDATQHRQGPVAVSSAADGRLRLLALARPDKSNALDAPSVDALAQAFQAACADSVPVAFTGEGRAFCGGFDFTGIEDQSEGDLLLRFARIELLLNAVAGAPVPSFALVQGAAFGAGADLAAACAYRIGTPRAKFRFPGFRFGVALGTRRLAAVVGTDAARAILLGNRLVGAQEALDIGLLTHLVGEDELVATSRSILDEHAGLSAEATARILRLTATDTGDADLADMVRSLVLPGLHARIEGYRGQHK
ncbi:enoyl-CoA hydratase/isomerase family protein [Ancylobacter sp. MQZ15Z-1]|uniref:Enoyl-CoA hydratase/isomerase family protein n=1 Tax=Ancylobacter mangrovi TaxID=2972472 RepID=A0A9X2PEN2_9HYPH|nr:enoyl-CoA hydratase/isomerase family protein [Ancylobacter mangrovi]MCS0494763.1 enoyl-CoA hydratase/isomerase family protein [Ancylobacter mangrovi]